MDAEFEIALDDGWECEFIEDEPWANFGTIYGVPYELRIPSDKDALAFKLRWA